MNLLIEEMAVKYRHEDLLREGARERLVKEAREVGQSQKRALPAYLSQAATAIGHLLRAQPKLG
ncbi:MAG TPA: hypothetical protein VFU22_29660 [Roseiflexaceae bacterium]|nr:hypothetical protein [Roseiflexaceae bacterium]